MRSRIVSFNDWVAVKVTEYVSTMWCAYAFAVIAVYGAKDVDWHNSTQAVQWLSQTFIQLVMLAVIMKGQDVQTRKALVEQHEMHDAVMAEHAELDEIIDWVREQKRLEKIIK